MHFSENALVQCGVKLAEILQLQSPSDEMFREKIEEILVRRKNYDAVLDGLITQEEAASLILQHFQTMVCHVNNTREVSIVQSWVGLIPSTVEALFIE